MPMSHHVESSERSAFGFGEPGGAGLSGSCAVQEGLSAGTPSLVWLSTLGYHAAMELDGECVDLPGDLGVGLQLQLGLDEVVVALRLLEGGLPVLPDEDERRQE